MIIEKPKDQKKEPLRFVKSASALKKNLLRRKKQNNKDSTSPSNIHEEEKRCF